ncbi:MAG: hypothetical protein AAFP79_05080 [Pseudomonadota bacterium]
MAENNEDEPDKSFAKNLQAQLDEITPEVPRQFEWSMVLAVNILRELDAQNPGFKEAIKGRVLESSRRKQGDTEEEDMSLRQSLVDLVESWVFEE